MSYAERHTVAVTTAADGSATAYTTGAITGQVVNCLYTADGTSPFDNTVDFTITAESSGLTIWQESNIAGSKTISPRQAAHGTDGVAAVYAAAGEPVEGPIFLAQERIKIVLAQGGNAKSGAFTFVIA